MFVVNNKDVAKDLAYGPAKQKFNCVTLDGDVYNTGGILSGGSQKSEPILGKIQQYLQIDQ